MLPSTITLNVGSPAGDVVFANPLREGRKVTYVAPSPNSDLAGQMILTFSSETTKSGAERTMYKFVEPVLNAVTGKYDSTRTWSGVLGRLRTDDTGANKVGRIVEMGYELLSNADVRNSIIAGSL